MLAIYDTMQFIKPAVATTCMGLAASAGAFLLMAGTNGKRAALPNSRIMIHQPLGGSQGQVSDLVIATEEAVQVLHAEWSYLNRPERLAALAARHLDLAPMTPRQIGSLDMMPPAMTPLPVAQESLR